MDFDSTKFASLLQKAIGMNSQAEFAKQCEISPEHLSRMLRGKSKFRPSINTLKKIAENSNVPLKDLLAACGYDADEKSSMTVMERVQTNAESMRNGFRTMTNDIRLYSSLHDFLDEHQMLYGEEDAKVFLGTKREYDGDEYRYAEYYTFARCVFPVKDNECTIYFVIFFCETKGGQVLVTDVAMDGKTLFECGYVSQKTVDDLYADGEDINKLPFFYNIKSNNTAEMRLLKALFGGNMERYPYTVRGFGLDISNTPPNFTAFLKNHKNSFVSDEDDERIALCDKVDRGEAPEAVFADFEDAVTTECGLGAVISTIMRDETGIDFEWWKNKDADTGAVMVLDEIDTDRRELKTIVNQYAKELGLKQYGQCLVFTEMFRDGNEIYDVQ